MSKKPWWSAEAAVIVVPQRRLRAPLAVVLAEANDVARFVRENGRGRREGARTIRGLEVVGDERLAGPIAEEIDSLVDAIAAAHQQYRLLGSGRDNGPHRRRAQEVLGTLRSSLRWIAARGSSVGASELAAISGRASGAGATSGSGSDGRRDRTHYGLAMRLAVAVDVARRHLRDLRAFAGLDAELLEEGEALVATLRAIPVASRALDGRTRAVRDQRDRLLMLLDARVRLVRMAARFVFLGEPKVARQVGSAWERRAKAGRRVGKGGR